MPEPLHTEPKCLIIHIFGRGCHIHSTPFGIEYSNLRKQNKKLGRVGHGSNLIHLIISWLDWSVQFLGSFNLCHECATYVWMPRPSTQLFGGYVMKFLEHVIKFWHE